jgi:hypothetical protein
MNSVLNYFRKVSSESFELIDSLGSLGWILASIGVITLGVIFLRNSNKRI